MNYEFTCFFVLKFFFKILVDTVILTSSNPFSYNYRGLPISDYEYPNLFPHSSLFIKLFLPKP